MRVAPVGCSSRNTLPDGNSAVEPLLPWARLRALLEAEHLDAVIASSPENVTYLSEYWGLSHWARRGTQVYAVAWNDHERSVDVVVPAALADLVTSDVAAHTRPHGYGRFVLETDGELDVSERRLVVLTNGHVTPQTPQRVLAKLLHDGLSGGGRVAVESTGLEEGSRELLSTELPHLEFVRAEALLAQCRAVKSRREIDLLSQAARITEGAVSAAFADLEPGVNELEVARNFQRALVTNGALPETTVIGSGRRSALPNALPGPRRIGRGDIVRFDVGCRFGHYVSDIARTAVVGEPIDEQRDLYRALSCGLESAARLLRPGVTTAEVFAAVVGAVREAGLPEYARTHCGHGIGIANYDLPHVAPGSEDVLEPGMAICLETPYYRLGRFGVQIEDTFVVTEIGAERLTSAPEEVLSVG